MDETVINPTIEKLDDCIDDGLRYLLHHQYPNGEFVCYFGPDEKMQEWCIPDTVTCMTSLIAHCLLPFSGRPEVAAALDRSVNFLQYQMMRGGVWQFFTKWHKAFPYLPPDLDDTSVASLFLKKRNITIPDNKPIYLANRSRSGLFYTWITFHYNFPFHKNTWLLRLRMLKSPIKSIIYRLTNEFKRSDLDSVVNANILYYWGERDFTTPIVDFFVDAFEKNKQLKGDQWYQNPVIANYFYARIFLLGIKKLEPYQKAMIEKVQKAMAESPQFDVSPIELGLALTSLINLGYKGSILEEIASKLIRLQLPGGEWERRFLYVVPSGKYGWGSEETTTAFVLEALNDYRKQLDVS